MPRTAVHGSLPQASQQPTSRVAGRCSEEGLLRFHFLASEVRPSLVRKTFRSGTDG